jgi:hypothetical protein
MLNFSCLNVKKFINVVNILKHHDGVFNILWENAVWFGMNNKISNSKTFIKHYNQCIVKIFMFNGKIIETWPTLGEVL